MVELNREWNGMGNVMGWNGTGNRREWKIERNEMKRDRRKTSGNHPGNESGPILFLIMNKARRS